MKTWFILILMVMCIWSIKAQVVMETGGQKMPNEWIDKDTHHKIIKLTRRDGDNLSFYFHNNPFVENKMVFYGRDEHKLKHLFTVDLTTFKIEQLTHHGTAISGEIVSVKRNESFYQANDSVFATDISSKKERLVFIFPENFKGDITTINADGSLLGGVWATPQEKEISKRYPEKHDYFGRIYESKLPRTLFTIDIEKGELKKVFTDSAWLNHVQFSPTDPNLLMFCHEGPWHKVDRIWTINIKSGNIKLIHKRTMDMEIAGHEWFSPDGNRIWFDLQMPRGKMFFVGGADVQTGVETKYQLQRDKWSVHYTISSDQRLFAGDGGDSSSVAKAKDGKWIYLFTPVGNTFQSEKLVSMRYHKYKLEPNVHFSPDGKWVIFRANFEGEENVYAVEIKK